MTEVLSQKEINELLAAINGQDYAKDAKDCDNKGEPVIPVFGKDEVLSQDEIDALLAGVDIMTLPSAAPKDANPSMSKIYTINDKLEDTVKVKKIDFKRPNKFTKDQIDTLTIIHNEAAKRLTDFLSDYLKSKVLIQVASVDQLTYEEFIRSIPTPTCFSIINIPPLEGNAVIEIVPGIYSPFLNILFGGDGNHIKLKAELTGLEKFVMQRLIARSFDAMFKPWKKIIELNPELKAIGTDPRYAQVSALDEMVLLVTLDCKIRNSENFINICYPYHAIKPIKNKITSKYYNSGVEVMDEPVKHDADKNSVPISVMIGERNLPLETIKELKVGNVLELDKTIDKDMDIYANDVIIARGEIVVIGDNFGIRITELAEQYGNNGSK